MSNRKTNFSDNELHDADPSSHAGIVLPDAEGEVAEAAARVLSGEGEMPMDSYIVEDAVYEVEKTSHAESQERAEQQYIDESHAEELAENPDYYEGGTIIMSPNEEPIELTEEEAWENEIEHLGYDPRNKDED